MTNEHPNQGDQGTPTEGGGGVPTPLDAFQEMPVETPRRASLTLRADNVREQRVASLEAANKSLADALRITYRLILALMVALVFVFIFTGVKQVNESEVGVKVTFGEVSAQNLQPGAHFNLPFPLGEIVTISQSQKNLPLDRTFVPAGFNAARPLAQAGMGKINLRPGIDGSLITADGSLVHARLSVGYRIKDADKYIKHIDPDAEQDLVKLIIERSTVRVFASVNVDDLLSRASTFDTTPPDGTTPDADTPAGTGASGGGAGSIERRIARAAQDSFDTLASGIQVTEVSLTSVFPPLRVYREFQAVNRVDSEAAKAREEAEEQRRRELNEVAGSAYRPLLDLMDEFENLSDLKKLDDAEAVLEEMFAIFKGERDGRSVQIDGRTYPEIVFSGRAAQQISNAQRTRQIVVDKAKRKAGLYQAKLAQYKANPIGFLAREWSEALRSFASASNVQQFHLPSKGDFTLLLNNDPDIARALQRARQQGMTQDYLDQADIPE